MTNYLQSAAGALGFTEANLDEPVRMKHFWSASSRRLINGLQMIFFKASCQHLVCAHRHTHIHKHVFFFYSHVSNSCTRSCHVCYVDNIDLALVLLHRLSTDIANQPVTRGQRSQRINFIWSSHLWRRKKKKNNSTTFSSAIHSPLHSSPFNGSFRIHDAAHAVRGSH